MSRSGALDDNEIQSEMNKMVRATARVTLLAICLPATSLILWLFAGGVHLARSEGESQGDPGQSRRGIRHWKGLYWDNAEEWLLPFTLWNVANETLTGKDCEAGISCYRCPVREETKASRGQLEDVRATDLSHLPNSLNHSSSSQSTAINNSRLKILQSRNDHLQTLFDEANKKVMELSAGDRYKDALVNLILEVSLIKMWYRGCWGGTIRTLLITHAGPLKASFCWHYPVPPSKGCGARGKECPRSSKTI